MALTKNMQYDHPAYLAVFNANVGTIGAGAAAVSSRFLAHTSLLIKSVNYSTITLGTGAATDVKSLVIARGAALSTATMALFTSTAAGTYANVLATGAFGTMTAGDAAWVMKGADATEVGAAGIEYLVLPGASVTP